LIGRKIGWADSQGQVIGNYNSGGSRVLCSAATRPERDFSRNFWAATGAQM
jgi:hypothetical protein